MFGVAVLLCAVACAAAREPRFEKAVPVWPKGCETEMNAFFGFRAAFEANETDRPVLRVTGCSDYRISLNGRHVGWGPARAAKGHFRVDEIPLAPKKGTNVVAIEVAGYNCNSFCLMDQPPFLQAEVMLAGRVVAATGEGGAFAAQRLPRVQKVVRYSYQRPFSEFYRLRPGFDTWKKGQGAFAAVPLAEMPPVRLLPRRAPYADFRVNGPFRLVSFAQTRFDATMKTKPIRFVDVAGAKGIGKVFQKEELEKNWWDLVQRHVMVSRRAASAEEAARPTFALADGASALFDAGLNDTGFVGLRVKCLKPGTVAVKFDEILVNGEVSPTRYSCANVVAWEFAEVGEYEVESFEPYTFRYADAIACDGAFEISAPHLRTYKNPEAARAKLESSDPALVKIFEAARETYAQNAADVFTDCPGRERAGWLCDSFFTSRSSLLFTGNLSSEHLFLENFVLPDSFDNIPAGMFAMCYPADFPDGNFIPNWAMWLVLEVEEFKRRGGDPRLVAAFRPKLAKLVDYLKTFRNADGLLEKLPRWVFVEWSRANRLVQDVNYPSNMTWAEVLDAMDRLYGMPELAAEAARVRETIRRQSWTGTWFCDNAVRQKDGTLKLSGECTETCQYYAFYFRTATPKTHPELWRTLVEDFGPRRKETKLHPEIWPSNAFIGNYLRLECLAREGLSAKILEETRDYFLYMAELTGTLWENIGTTASCNHGFASHAAVSYCRDVLGLRAIDPVRKTVVFRPPTDLPLESIAMEIPVEGGTIRAGWRKTDRRLSEELCLPVGWRRIDAPPPSTLFDIRDFGASPDAAPAENAKAIQKALDTCSTRGGGKVVVPKGVWNCGTLWLRSKTELHLADGAVLKASADLADYNAQDAYPENWGSQREEWNGCHFIIAREVEEIAITGPGALDGNSGVFFEDKPRSINPKAIGWTQGMRKARDREKLRPGQMVALIRSRDIFVGDGLTISNSPCWCLFFYGCTNAVVRDYTVRNGRTDGNTDGVDIDCSHNVSVTHADIFTGDDGVAIRASGKRFIGGAAAAPPCSRIHVAHCDLTAEAQGIRIGVGEGLIRDVCIENVTIRHGTNGVAFDTFYGHKEGAGVDIEDIVFRNFVVEDCYSNFRLRVGGNELKIGLRNVLFQNDSFGASILCIRDGDPDAALADVRFDGCTFTPWPGSTFKHIMR